MNKNIAKTKKTAAKTATIALIVILVASFLASMFHSDFGKVDIKEVSYVSEDGGVLHGILYIPKGIKPDRSAPGIVAAHGYNNTAEVQGINSIELARRGYVVFAIDHYGHGESGFPDEDLNGGIVGDAGSYSGLQYVGNLPYVNPDKVGMVGHSMGGGSIQSAALRAFQEKEAGNTNVITPAAVLPTANSFSVGDDGVYELGKYPVNVGDVYGAYDEWAESMWGTIKGSDVRFSHKATGAMGFEAPEYNTLYKVNDSTPLSKENIQAAVDNGEIRVIYSVPVVHPVVHFSFKAVGHVVDFFDITLRDSRATIPSGSQIWFGKDVFGGIALIAFFVFVTAFGMFLLDTKFFETIVQKEPKSPTVIGGKKTMQYIVSFIIAALPIPFVYNIVSGYPIDIKAMGRAVPTLFPANPLFPMPTANALVLFNLITGAWALLVFYVTYKISLQKEGATLSSLGVKPEHKNTVAKSLLLAVIVFLAAYMTLVLAKYFFTVDFRFWVFSIKVLTPKKWPMYLVYLPFFAFSFVISSLTQNMSTRIDGKKEWVNTLIIAVSSALSLYVLMALDYGKLFAVGVKMFPYVYVPIETTSALAGVLLWGLLFILPIASIISRKFFKKTGNIWVGGFVNAFIVTLFAISNTVVSAGTL